MSDKNVCPKCGQIYDASLAKCPLCGAVAPQTPAAQTAPGPVSTRSSGGRYLSKEDKKALQKEEEAFLRSEEGRYRRMKRRGEDDAPEDATDPHIPTGFIAASVLILAAALFIGGSFLLWKTKLVKIGLYDRLAAKVAEPITEVVPSAPTTTPAPPAGTETESSTSEAEPSVETEEPQPAVVLPFTFDLSDPVLVLVNADNPIPDDYQTDDLVTLGSGARVSRLCLNDLQEMVNACRDAKHYPKVFEGYDKDAKDTSEFRTGLAVDIFPDSDPARDVPTQKQSETLMWLWEHCHEYGFVVRWPEGKEDFTGNDYEPWHFRYVGREVAAYMHDNDLCFEEMIALMKLAAE